MKFIHCSDLHVDSPLIGLERYPEAPVQDMRHSTRQALSNIVDAAIENDVDFVVIAGDIFDGNWRDFNTGVFFFAQMGRLRQADIPAILLKGNHDAESEITKSLRSIPGNVRILDHKKPQTVTLDHIGVAIHGQSFSERAVTRDLAAQYPEAIDGVFNLGMLHTCMGGYEAHLPYAPTTLDVLKGKAYDYWALGHVHERRVLNDTPRVVFCGNSQGRHARETGPKGCDLVNVDGGVVVNEFIPTDAVRWYELAVDIHATPDLDALLNQTGSKISELVDGASGRTIALRLRLHGLGRLHRVLVSDFDKAVAELRSVAIDGSDGRAWIERVKLDTRPDYDRVALATRDDPMGELVRLATQLEANDTELMSLAREALGPMIDKLPPELKGEMRLDDAEALKAILREAESKVFGILTKA